MMIAGNKKDISTKNMDHLVPFLFNNIHLKLILAH